ncbi:trypsin-like peptidase domain-containing protein [Thermocrispum sp.]|uniref:S1C family serine protease n=1 Tax=Thermocrispum sp. TaxID=2060768 RepID=UPI00257FD011|nr:trypsin-like peptidase domain-containing protein [Thermocrispum sp.]
MADNPFEPQQGDPERGGGPRLQPRGLERPPVDPHAAAVFGRPAGVTGPFDEEYRRRAVQAAERPGTRPAPPPPSLAEAFGPTPDDRGVVLQRPPDDEGEQDEATYRPTRKTLWGKQDDPWRNPGSPVALSEPALREDADDEDDKPQRRRASALSLSEIVLGGRLRRSAAVVCVVVVLLVGAIGGAVGWYIADQSNELGKEVTLAQVGSGKQRPPGSVAATVQEVVPAVVSIEIRTGSAGGVGSGVVIEEDGYIITNDHVVAPAAEDDDAKLTAVFTDGTRAPAKIVGRDPKTDLAVIKVNVRNPTVIRIGKSADLAPGDPVIAVGSPFGLENTVTVGVVSAVNRPISAPSESGEGTVVYDAIQTDAAINPGNSGGALVDARGALVGINSLIRTVSNERQEGGSIGLGFAIPVDQAIKIAEALIADGKVAHPELGVQAASVAANTSEGARVQNVVPNSAADRAGIREGDVIVRVGERMVRNAAELTVAVRAHEVGQRVPIKLVRGGREIVTTAKLGSDDPNAGR